ncbi:hypothetical protein [Tabrizicola sp.]|uniref:hypothetical protein n=1 Tax=Tabrizicola sp. TaxID=2005166 RepID=UPI0025DE3738|nr:hypothetical protein [Tabrizicola sp.]
MIDEGSSSGKDNAEYRLAAHDDAPKKAGPRKLSSRSQYLLAASFGAPTSLFCYGIAKLIENDPADPQYYKVTKFYVMAGIGVALTVFALWKAWKSPSRPEPPT